MKVMFDRQTGQLRLDRVSFDAMLALAAGAEPPAVGLEKTRDAGVVDGTSVHPIVRPAMAAAADPTAVARLEMRSDEGTVIVAECWVAPNAATYLVGAPDDSLELISTAPGFFPVSIARLVGLSPRPRTAFQPWRMPIEMVDETFSDDIGRRRDATTPVANATDDDATQRYVDALTNGPWWYWNLGVQWPAAPGNDGARSLHVVDTQTGMAILSLSDGRIAVDPTNPTEIFQLLTAILPRDDELDLAAT